MDTLERFFKKYKEECCKYCTNCDCESGSGIHVFVEGDIICSKCVDYISNRKIKKNNLKLVGVEERRRKNNLIEKGD